ncbi:MAG TPA: alpha-amylase family glycosyl hydrolase [Aestuariivirgaceae bacterium]|nr:alpha-amylase family glycosyl hydrolase [Aestuariivirgaceae bacterium]
MNDPEPANWWQRGVIYQVYPRSFQDSNGDGIGDLNGIAGRLDHLVGLGVEAIWISPIFLSPMADFGYDVADHRAVDPIFGSLADFDRLLAAAHAKGLRIILDFVPNHTSDQHPWFVESRSSRKNAKRDWYVWRAPRGDGGPPTNWLSEFGGPAWTLDAVSGEYYYHAYLKEQPDLNWRTPAVRAAMLDVLRFWFRRGVDGFRVDAIHQLIEDDRLRDNPPDANWRPGMSPARRLLRAYTMDQPEVHEAIAAMRQVADSFGDKVMIGEAYLPIDRLMAYYGVDLTGFQLPFNFHLMSTPWTPTAVAALIQAYERALPRGGWPNWVLGNHDRSRVASRLGCEQARVAAMLLLTLRGTATIYQGEEIGMTDVAISPEQVVDPWEKNVPGLGLGRDPVRTPLPWDASPKGGFTSGEPWLPLGPEHDRVNVACEARDPQSMLSLYRALLALRRREEALVTGQWEPVAAGEQVLLYERRRGSRAVGVALNMTAKASEASIAGPATVLLSTHLDRTGRESSPKLRLRPHEGLIFER